MDIDFTYPAVVFGTYETGLGVARALGKAGIHVHGMDVKKEIGFYSKFVHGQICPHPVKEEGRFIDHLVSFGKILDQKSVLFVTSDNFIPAISRNRDILQDYFQFNLPSAEILNNTVNKFNQYHLFKDIANLPLTFQMESPGDLDIIGGQVLFPAFIKGREVQSWRSRINGRTKGFIARDKDELFRIANPILQKGIPVIVQDLIPGPDTNHYKYCGYFSLTGKCLASFTLQKKLQFPRHSGVGAIVESCNYPELEELGRSLLETISYTGIGSIEFKLDARDGKLKLIELNPRYWQQISLATACGINFPFIDYLESTRQQVKDHDQDDGKSCQSDPGNSFTFKTGVKWINYLMAMQSVDRSAWSSLTQGPRVFSDFAADDPLPAMNKIRFWKKISVFLKFIFCSRKG